MVKRYPWRWVWQISALQPRGAVLWVGEVVRGARRLFRRKGGLFPSQGAAKFYDASPGALVFSEAGFAF